MLIGFYWGSLPYLGDWGLIRTDPLCLYMETPKSHQQIGMTRCVLNAAQVSRRVENFGMVSTAAPSADWVMPLNLPV